MTPLDLTPDMARAYERICRGEPQCAGSQQPAVQLGCAWRARMPDNIAADQLRLLIERIERLEEEKKGISEDIKDVYGEAKSTGFDTKTMRKIVALRKMEKHQRDEAAALLDTYCAALGMQLGLGI